MTSCVEWDVAIFRICSLFCLPNFLFNKLNFLCEIILLATRLLHVVELAVLSELKIASLESQKKEAKQGYQDHLQAYVTSYLGQPLEKVHVSAVLL